MCLRPFQFHIYKNVKGMEEISSVAVDVFMRRAFRSVPYVNKIIAASLKKIISTKHGYQDNGCNIV